MAAGIYDQRLDACTASTSSRKRARPAPEACRGRSSGGWRCDLRRHAGMPACVRHPRPGPAPRAPASAQPAHRDARDHQLVRNARDAGRNGAVRRPACARPRRDGRPSSRRRTSGGARGRRSAGRRALERRPGRQRPGGRARARPARSPARPCAARARHRLLRAGRARCAPPGFLASPSCAMAMPAHATGASSRRATRFRAPSGSPAASARAAAVISESTGIQPHL
jgi:hypothetical protein